MDNQNNPNLTISSDAEIGARISALRKRKHYNQAFLASRLSKSLRTVQKYESGEIKISVDVANQLAFILDSTPEYILGYDSRTRTLKTMADVLDIMFELEDVANLDFNIHVERPPYSTNWLCSIEFDGLDQDAELNQEMCKFFEDWSRERNLFRKENHVKEIEYQFWRERYKQSVEKIPVFSLATPSLREYANEYMHKPVPSPSPGDENGQQEHKVE